MNHYKQAGPLGSSKDKKKKGAKNSFCDWSRSHVSKQMNVGGQIRLHCSKQWIIKQMLDLFSVLNLILLASSQPLLALKMSPIKRQSLLNGKFHERQRTWLVTIRIVMLSKKQQPQQQTFQKNKKDTIFYIVVTCIVQHINYHLFKNKINLKEALSHILRKKKKLVFSHM